MSYLTFIVGGILTYGFIKWIIADIQQYRRHVSNVRAVREASTKKYKVEPIDEWGIGSSKEKTYRGVPHH